jgi:hypothetical protein
VALALWGFNQDQILHLSDLQADVNYMKEKKVYYLGSASSAAP